MSNTKLDQIAEQLNQSGDYRVIRRYQKPEYYNRGNEADTKFIAVFLDVETTGLSSINNKLIELGMVKFEYTEDGRIFKLLEDFNSYQDPHISIPEHITKLTGITDDIVKGHSINESEVISYLDNVDIIIAHNAGFDRLCFFTPSLNTPIEFQCNK
jgi:DNA polymerase-3 subunit epsilon